MRSNVNILTAASETAVQQSITGYENSTAAHVSGDWGAHNQVLFYATPFAEFSVGHTIANGYLLRLMLTGTNVDGTGDAAFTCPAIVSGIDVDVGGAPYIIRHPDSLSLFVSQIATFTVKAISADPLSYQWRKNNENITGATASTYVIGSVKTTDQAAYDVIVSNSYGTATSTTANLTVQAASAGFSINQDGCFLPDTLITMADGTQRQIKLLRPGDRVASYRISGLNPANEQAWRSWQAAALNLTASVATVKEAFLQRFDGYFQILDLKVTYEHPLLTRRNGIWAFREAQDIKTGDMLWKNGMSIPVDRMIYVRGEIETYNLNVEDTDVFLANGFMAHNNFFKSTWRFITPETAIIGAIVN
jgi:hypothetical protein